MIYDTIKMVHFCLLAQFSANREGLFLVPILSHWRLQSVKFGCGWKDLGMSIWSYESWILI